MRLKDMIVDMRDSSLYRANLSDEKVAFLSEMKNKKETGEDNTPKTYKRQNQGKSNELDRLWDNFDQQQKEEKSPGVYITTGFVFGALCMFVMTSILSIGANLTENKQTMPIVEHAKFEKKISRTQKTPLVNNENTPASVTVVPANTKNSENIIPVSETYTVKQGDSMSSIVYRFYGKYDLDKVEKIKQANNLNSEHKLSVGQQLVIPLD